MNCFSLALRSVIRKPVKSTLLFVAVFIISLLLLSGMGSGKASIVMQDNTRQAMGAGLLLEENEADRHRRIEELSGQLDHKEGSLGGYHQEKLTINGVESWRTWTDNSFETLTYGDIIKISEVDGVSDFNITTANTVVNPVNFQRIEDKDVDQSSDQLGVSLRGNLQMKYDFDVQNGNIVVNDGRMINREDKDVCVISRELAELNGLKVGDTLEFNNWKER